VETEDWESVGDGQEGVDGLSEVRFRLCMARILSVGVTLGWWSCCRVESGPNTLIYH
jgi:hypothetical protein